MQFGLAGGRRRGGRAEAKDHGEACDGVSTMDGVREDDTADDIVRGVGREITFT